MKKSLSVLLILVLMAALLAACGSNNNAKNNAKANNTNTPSDKQATEGAESPELTAESMDSIIEAAKKEGHLMLYTGLPLDAATEIGEAFTKKYDIIVDIWRASGGTVLQRATVEAAAKRAIWDVLEAGDSMPGIHEQGLLKVPMDDIFFENVPAGLIPADKSYVPIRSNLIVGAYNSTLVKKEDLPKTYEDLLDPKWKGKLAIEAADHFWLKDLVQYMGEEKGIKLFEDIVATNGLSVRDGHSLLGELVSNGEIPYSLTVYNNKVDSLKEAGAPIEMHILKPAIVYPIALGLAKNSNSPNAAKLYVHFMVNEGQDLLNELHFNPTSKNVKTILSDITSEDLVYQNHFENLKEMDKWVKIYEDMILKNSSAK